MKYTFGKIAINSTAKKKPTEEDKYHYIGLEHLSSDTFDISNYGSDVAPTGEKLIMQKGDILFGKRRAYQKKVGISPIDGIFSAHGFVLRPRKEIINPEYFPFFIASNQFLETAIRISVGGLSPTVNWKDLEKQEFDLPSLSEQKILAEKLWAAYHLKESYKKMIEATDEMVKSRFIEMFGNPFLNDKNWERYETLESVTQIVLGSTPDTKNPSYWDGECRWITPAEMDDETFIVNDTVRHITQEGVKKAHLTLMPEGSVLLSTRAPIGKIGIVGKEMYCNQGFKNFICGDDIDSVFLYYTLKLNKGTLCSMGTGTTFKELSRKSVASIKVSIPPIQLQKEFDTIYKQADKSKFELREAIKRVESMMKSLMNS